MILQHQHNHLYLSRIRSLSTLTAHYYCEKGELAFINMEDLMELSCGTSEAGAQGNGKQNGAACLRTGLVKTRVSAVSSTGWTVSVNKEHYQVPKFLLALVKTRVCFEITHSECREGLQRALLQENYWTTFILCADMFRHMVRVRIRIRAYDLVWNKLYDQCDSVSQMENWGPDLYRTGGQVFDNVTLHRTWFWSYIFDHVSYRSAFVFVLTSNLFSGYRCFKQQM